MLPSLSQLSHTTLDPRADSGEFSPPSKPAQISAPGGCDDAARELTYARKLSLLSWQRVAGHPDYRKRFRPPSIIPGVENQYNGGHYIPIPGFAPRQILLDKCSMYEFIDAVASETLPMNTIVKLKDEQLYGYVCGYIHGDAQPIKETDRRYWLGLHGYWDTKASDADLHNKCFQFNLEEAFIHRLVDETRDETKCRNYVIKNLLSSRQGLPAKGSYTARVFTGQGLRFLDDAAIGQIVEYLPEGIPFGGRELFSEQCAGFARLFKK